MKTCLIILLSAVCMYSSAQIKVPTTFYKVKGASPAGRDDYYTDGQYILSMWTPFQAENPATDEQRIVLLTRQNGIAFNKTKDGLYVGEGFNNHVFKYIVVAKGLSYILKGKQKNKGFVQYSNWLLTSIRTHIVYGEQLYFKE